MIAAIYARKSTDQNVADEEKSVTRQVDRARAYATAKGWAVADEHIYTDDGISGAEFVKRPGFLRLLNAVTRRPAFQVLIMSEESRLGRESIETGWTLRKITDAGVRVFYYLEDRERTLGSSMDKVMMHLSTFAAEMEREKAVQRTRDAMRRKAERGHVAGGTVYGYDNHRVADHVERRINPAQAEVLRRIFREIAGGRGFTRVAKALTADGIPSPHPGQGWAATAVRAMVFRELYCGRQVYGKTRWERRGGTKRKVQVPEAEWLTMDAPALRIIEPTLWDAAHRRLDRTRAIYLRRTNGKLWGRPEAGLEAKYLLSGFVVCGTCGGAMHATKRTSLRGAPQLYYVCRTHRVRGDLICRNSLSAPMGELDTDVLTTFERDVLSADVIDAVVRRAIELERVHPDELAAQQETLRGRLRQIDTEIGRFTDAIRQFGPLATIGDELRALERRRGEVQAQLEHLDGLATAAGAWDAHGLAGEFTDLLTEWQALLAGDPVQARQILRKLITGRLTMVPEIRPDGRFYRWTGQASYGRLLAGIIGVQAMVPPG
jgi:DNA invertase Pin-like site-specific DNA recombinase